MSERFSYTEPILWTNGFNIKKPWMVCFTFKDKLTGHCKRLQFRGPINSYHNKEERILYGNALKDYWKKQLKAGYNPFAENDDLPLTRPLITQALDLILQIKATSCGDRTMQTYRYVVKLFKAWLTDNRLHNIFIHQFDLQYARAYMDHLAIKKGYSGRTFNDQLTVLSTFYNCMIDRDWVEKNPFRKIKKVPVEVGRNIAYSDTEKELLKNHLKQHDRQLYYFTQFIYYGFIRRSELTRLKIDNIDWNNMSIVIPSNASKNKKQESVVIPDSFVQILKEMGLQDLPGSWFIFGRYLKPGPVQYINYNHISTRHNKIAKGLGIDTEKGLYSWKHSGACAAYQVLNGDMYSLMRQLRHTELTTTQIYLKSLGLVDNAAIRNAVW